MNDLRICKDEAEVVRLMFEKAMREGLGPLRIANYLNSPVISIKPYDLLMSELLLVH